MPRALVGKINPRNNFIHHVSGTSLEEIITTKQAAYCCYSILNFLR